MAAAHAVQGQHLLAQGPAAPGAHRCNRRCCRLKQPPEMGQRLDRGVRVRHRSGATDVAGRPQGFPRARGRHQHVVEHHFMAAGGAHAEVVPGVDDAHAGAVLGHQPGAHQRVGVIAARPYAEPAQAMAAGGVDLAPADAPTLSGAHGGGRRQPATGRGAEVGFDAQGVDQCAVAHRVLGHLCTQMGRPGLAVLQAGMLQVLHHQDQCGGRFALGNCTDRLARLRQAGTAATEGFGHGEGDQAVVMQPLEVGVGEGAALVIQVRGAGQLGAQVFEQGVEIDNVHSA